MEETELAVGWKKAEHGQRGGGNGVLYCTLTTNGPLHEPVVILHITTGPSHEPVEILSQTVYNTGRL